MSLKDVAARAGVSLSTVSRTLNGDTKCASPEVRERIWSAARELGYSPNQAAKALQAGTALAQDHKYVITIVLARVQDTEDDVFFKYLEQAVGGQLIKAGHTLSKTVPSGALAQRDFHLSSHGVIVLGRCFEDTLDKLRRYSKNVVCIGLNPFPARYDQVFCDGRGLAAAAVEYLAGLGHQSIGYVGECSSESRFVGYRQAMEKRRLATEPAFVYQVRQSEWGGGEAADHYLAAERKPSALFCANDVTAIGFIKRHRELEPESRLPAIVAVDDIAEAQHIQPPLTTIRVPVEEMGTIAVKILLDRMGGGHNEPLKIEFPYRLIKRASG